jgi:hypothetical protein
MRQSARQKRPTFILCPTTGEVKGYVLHAPTDRDSEAVYPVCGFVLSILFSQRDRPNEPIQPRAAKCWIARPDLIRDLPSETSMWRRVND